MSTDTTMPLQVAQMPSDTPEMPHMTADTFSLPVVSRLTVHAMRAQPGRFACAIFREASDAATGRPALSATCWSAAHTPAARQRRALEMREAGYTMAAIARELGYRSASGARYAVEAARTRREGARDVA